MNKNIIRLTSTLLLLFLMGTASISGLGQGKEKTKKDVSNKKDIPGGSIRRISNFRDIRGEVTGNSQNKIEEDFIKEPKKIIEFRIEHLLIKPTDTISLGGAFGQKTENGKTISYSYLARLTDHEKESKIDVFITPQIIADKGIDLSIKVLFDGKTLKEDKVLTNNYESVVVELLENKEQKSKLADRVLPLILTIEPPKIYPKVLTELKFLNYTLFMNNELLYHAPVMDLTVPGGSEKKPIFFAFFIRGKGIYILSFSPFRGAEPIGVAKENVVKFKYENDYFEFTSVKPILPEGKWLVWVRNNPTYLPENDIPRDSSEISVGRNVNIFFWFDSSGELIERVLGKGTN